MPAPLITLLDISNTPIGPFPIEEVQRRLKTGEFRPTQLAFTEGLTEWTPLAAVMEHFQPPAVAVLHPVSTPPPFVPVVSQAVNGYAGFWLRAAAYLLDGMILFAVLYGIMAALMLIANPSGFTHDLHTGSSHAVDNSPDWVKLVYLAAVVFGPLFYFTLMESSAKQGTVGKMAIGLKVTDLQGQRLRFEHALGRNALKMISIIAFFVMCSGFIGFIMAAFTEKQQALHDLIARTLVLKK